MTESIQYNVNGNVTDTLVYIRTIILLGYQESTSKIYTDTWKFSKSTSTKEAVT